MLESEGRIEELKAKYSQVWENEAVFRAVLKDLQTKGFVPKSVDIDGDLNAMAKQYFHFPLGINGFGVGEFAVGPREAGQDDELGHLRLHWGKLGDNEVVIEVHDFSVLSGMNHILLYGVDPKFGGVEFKGETEGMRIRS